MEPWTGTQRAFAVRAFYRNDDSFVVPQREFRRVQDSSQSCCTNECCFGTQITNELTNWMEQSPCEANSFLSTQEIPRMLWNTKFQYPFRKFSSVTRINPVYTSLYTHIPTVLFQRP